MGSDRWAVVSRLTAEAFEQPAGERTEWLARECAGDESLRLEVEALLAADAAAGRFMDQPAFAHTVAADTIEDALAPRPTLAAARRIGAYQVVRELGHGGMGAVYLAARADQAFDKHVAVKVVRGALPSEALERRFQDERRILATLDHPYVARLIDGGATEDGLSYLVMEYVDGVSIDDYCREQRLGLQARLQLFLRVCEAVQYAHQRLVIHRDLKPRNILVTADGTPKLLDFGIAKLMAQAAGDGDQAMTVLRAFTLENASPEQVRAEPMTVTSDVYALGVLLFQLITGERPYAVGGDDAALIRAICDDPPLRPSIAARGSTGLNVGPELEAVVLKSLRKEPERRYQSADLFAEDLRRLLAGLPVSAAPDSRLYRTRKFVSRHRLAVAAAAVFALSLSGALVATLWQARRADEQRQLAERRLQGTRRLANAMVFELNDSLEAGATSARALLLQRAAEQLDALAGDSPQDPVLAEELATAYHRLGNLLGLAGSANTGDRVAARMNHRKGLAIRQALVGLQPDDVERRARLVASLIDTTYAEDEVAPSLAHARAAVETAGRLQQARPRELRLTRLLARAHYTLGSQYRAIGDNVHALPEFERAAPLFQEVYEVAPNAEVRRSLALCQKRLGAILVDQAQYSRALDHLRRAVDLDVASLAENPRADARQRDLSTSHIELGNALLRSGDADGALAAFRRAESIREALVAADPTNDQASRDLASVLWYLGTAENVRRNYGPAIDLFEHAARLERTPRYEGDNTMARIASGLADGFEGLGRRSEAADMRRTALQRSRLFLQRQPESRTLRLALVTDALALSATLGRTREACAAVAEAKAAADGGDIKSPHTVQRLEATVAGCR